MNGPVGEGCTTQEVRPVWQQMERLDRLASELAQIYHEIIEHAKPVLAPRIDGSGKPSEPPPPTPDSLAARLGELGDRLDTTLESFLSIPGRLEI